MFVFLFAGNVLELWINRILWRVYLHHLIGHWTFYSADSCQQHQCWGIIPAFLWCCAESSPPFHSRGFRPTYTSCLDEECQDLLKQYEESGDPYIADHLIESLDVARHIVGKNRRRRWTLRTQAGRVGALIRRLRAAQQPPKSTHPSVSTNAVATHLIRVAKAPHDEKFERQVRMQGRTLLQQMSDKSLPHPFTEEEISTALQKTKPSDNPRLQQHPRGIPDEPGPQSSHLAVQILLQNHGYPFHPKDLEKGQGDSC